MCGRYTQTGKAEKVLVRFGVGRNTTLFQPRYNIAHGQQAPVMVNHAGKEETDETDRHPLILFQPGPCADS